MKISAVASNSVSKADFQNATKLNQTLNTSSNFKGVNSSKVLSAMDAQSLSSKAQVSFSSNSEHIYEIKQLWDKINSTPDDKINDVTDFHAESGLTYKSTLLIRAAELGSSDAIEVLRKKGADPNVSINGYTALMCAAFDGQTEAIKALQQFDGIDVNHSSKNGNTALILAVRKDHIEAVKALQQFDGIDANAADEIGRTALMYAAFFGNTEAIKALKEFRGIDVNATDRAGYTALILAADQGQTEAVSELRWFSRIDPNITTNAGETALMCAKKGALVKELLCIYGIDVNKTDYMFNQTALDYAMGNYRVKAVQALLEDRRTVVDCSDIRTVCKLYGLSGCLFDSKEIHKYISVVTKKSMIL